MPLHDEILELERRTVAAATRDTQETFDLLADDMVEFGATGRVYNRDEVIEILRNETPRSITIEDFKVRPLADGVALATFRARDGSIESLRSSIWLKHDGGWKIAFHQGTRIGKS